MWEQHNIVAFNDVCYFKGLLNGLVAHFDLSLLWLIENIRAWRVDCFVYLRKNSMSWFQLLTRFVS